MSHDSTEGTPPEEGLTERPLTRLEVLKAGALGVATVTAAGALAGREAQPAAAATPTALQFLTQWEFDYVTAMAETIWPTDDLGPGAREAGVGWYIDGQLAGSWGKGHRFYLNGPFYTPADTGHGWQIPMTPAEVYRAFLPAFDVYCKAAYGDAYPALTAAMQTQALTDLQANRAGIPLAGSTAFANSDFFAMFRQNVIEGMLADPAYGGNRNMVGWKWVGFPGDPMRYGDRYGQYIFSRKPYPYENKPLPLASPALVARGAAAPGPKTVASAAKGTKTGGM